MTQSCILQGRRIEPTDLEAVRALVDAHPQWSRYRLSRELCALWEWRSERGVWKDMAARTLLSKLHDRGWIRLPERRVASPNRHRLAPPPPRDWEKAPIRAKLGELGPLRIEEISGRAEERAEARSALASFHYLGYRAAVGENLQYVVRDGGGRMLSVMVFGAAAWKCAARDRWIGWEPRQREAGLGKIANQSRFLILPWVEVHHLASHLLGAVARRIAKDWESKYGHRVVMLESFVEAGRFRGTCYRAAGWQEVGATTGRSRQDRKGTLRVPVKQVFVLPLRADFRRELMR
ncbi:MAG: Druantia anti-phage system protein DruA [Planctomycetota bacterium]